MRLPSLILCALTVTLNVDALAAAPKRVVVSGAGGQTGQSLFRQMLALPDEFRPLGLVRSEESKATLVASGVPAANVAVVDITDGAAVRAVVGDATDAVCVCTSAKPAPSAVVDPETGRPTFTFPNGDPEVVDWLGQKNQIDACPPGAHVVICSTMGGTDPSNMLNSLGRVVNADDGTTSGGNIVMWKRKSEKYLMQEKTELRYTIVHPGGLVNEPGDVRELVFGVDDDQSYGNTESRTVPREDVARVMLEAVRRPAVFAGRSFDLRAKPIVEGAPAPDTNFETVLDSYLDGKNCDYSLGESM